MSADSGRHGDFLAFSSVVTGFGVFHLRGTGQVELYLATVDDIVGEEIVGQLLDTFCGVMRDAGEDQAAVQAGLRREILSDAKLGPVARALIKLWYVGTWYQLPVEWREHYGQNAMDRTFVVSAGSYTEGLLWPAIGANPAGAKALGYGMWATPPLVDTGH
jgi:hypothetical protein